MPEDESYLLRIMDKTEIADIRAGTRSPVSAPDGNPFLGLSVEEVGAWFETHIRKAHAEGFARSVFIILDEKSVEKENCLLVCWQADPEQRLRCDWWMALHQCLICDIYREGLGRGSAGPFLRTGTELTVHGYEMVVNNGSWMNKGVPEVDEGWKAFAKR